MYDFIRLETSSRSFANHLLGLPILTDKMSGFNHNTSEILGTIKAKYRGLNFQIFPSGRIVIYGSLHKYFNLGEHNHNDFSYHNLLLVLSDLKTKFGNEVLKMSVTGVEFGLNINTLFDPTLFVDRCISHSNKERSPIVKDDLKGFEKGISFNTTDFRVKIYNKSKQYRQPINILRLEVKYLRNRIFKEANVRILADILNPDAIKFFSEDLFKKISQLIYVEELGSNQLNRREERIYLECINSLSWVHWSKEKRHKRRIQFAELMKYKSKGQNLENVINLMRIKHSDLMYNDGETDNDFHNILHLQKI